MNIDLEKAKKEFIKYTEKYDLENKNIQGKQLHSLRVMEISTKIAEALELTQEEIDLATLIGLLHDIARFEQYVRFKNYNVISNFDHGDYAVEILNKDIRKYIETDKYDDIIKIAIKNHNKFKIEEGISSQQEIFAKIVRDADKIDILYEATEIFWRGKEEKINESKLSQEIYNAVNQRKLIKIEKDRKYNTIDDMLITLAYTFDINFKQSYQIIQKEDYINKTIKRFNFKEEQTKWKVEELIKNINDYIYKRSL